jgi:hypothetical protein
MDRVDILSAFIRLETGKKSMIEFKGFICWSRAARSLFMEGCPACKFVVRARSALSPLFPIYLQLAFTTWLQFLLFSGGTKSISPALPI